MLNICTNSNHHQFPSLVGTDHRQFSSEVALDHSFPQGLFGIGCPLPQLPHVSFRLVGVGDGVHLVSPSHLLLTPPPRARCLMLHLDGIIYWPDVAISRSTSG